MYLGSTGKEKCKTSIGAPNQSVCLTGLSGSGKTTRLNWIEYAYAKDEGTVIVLDLNMSHSMDRIFTDISKNYLDLENRITVLEDGIGDGLLQTLTPRNDANKFVLAVNAAVQALSSGQHMGVRQVSALRRAVIEAMELRKMVNTDAGALALALAGQDDNATETVSEKLWTILHCNALKPTEKAIEDGKINIIDFSGTDPITQVCLAEIYLTNFWQKVRNSDDDIKQKKFIIVLDEFQNLSLKKDSILPVLLREGRKFGISLLLATQSLEIFPPEVLAMLDQTATKLYFRQTQREARRIAKDIDAAKIKEWSKMLTGLRVGEALAVGNLCVNGVEIERPLLLK